MSKKILYILLTVLLLSVMTACNNKEEKPDNTNDEVKEDISAEDLLSKVENNMMDLNNFSMKESYNVSGEIALQVEGDIYREDGAITKMNTIIKEGSNDSGLKYVFNEGTLYMANISEPDQWIQLPMSEGMLETFQLNSQFALSNALNYGGNVEIEENGNQYIVKIESDNQEKLAQELIDRQNIFQASEDELAQLKENITFKSISYRAIIDKKELLLQSLTSDIKYKTKDSDSEETVSLSLQYENHNSLGDFELPEGISEAVNLNDLNLEEDVE